MKKDIALHDVIVTTKFYGESGSVTSDCVAITFTVPETANTCTVNGFPVTAGDERSIEIDYPYRDVTRYEFVFSGAAVGGNQLFVTRIVPKGRVI